MKIKNIEECISLIFAAMLIIFIPPVLAEGSASASRIIENSNLSGGGSTNVTITFTNDNISQALSLMEIFPSGWALTEISDNSSAFKTTSNEWIWFNVGPADMQTIIYRLSIPRNATPGAYYINGSVSNSSGVIANITGENAITVTSGNNPVADCGPNKLRCENVGAKVQFNGTASYDPDGSIGSYAWQFGDDTIGMGAAPNHTYAAYRWNGSAYQPFMVNLTVTDSNGLTNSTSQKVTIWIAGDANGDGNVNILDASVIGLKWNQNDACADLNNDGAVNILDASIIGMNWGNIP